MWDVEWKAALRTPAVKALADEAGEILERIRALELPRTLRTKLNEIESRLGRLTAFNEARHQVVLRWVVLAALRLPLDEAAATTEEPRRRLVERAFLLSHGIYAFKAELSSGTPS